MNLGIPRMVKPGRLLLTGALLAAAFAQAAEEVRFVTCPIYRDVDAGRKSGCWLADYVEGGVRYDITGSPTKPDWNHPVLVEGIPSSDTSTDACGAPMLDPVRVSVLPGHCTRHILPAEGYNGHPFVLPERNVRPIHEKRELPPKPYPEQTFHIPFDFGRDFIVYQLSDYYIDKASLYALDIDASRVEITGYAATEPAEISGEIYREPPELAMIRARHAAEWLELMGYPADRISVEARTGAQPNDMEGADGLTEPSRRRVEIRVIP